MIQTDTEFLKFFILTFGFKNFYSSIECYTFIYDNYRKEDKPLDPSSLFIYGLSGIYLTDKARAIITSH